MAATPIARGTKFYAPTITKVDFLATCADKTAPTRAEIDAGTELMNVVSAVNGFTISSNMIDAPDYGSKFTSQTAGRTQVSDSSLTCYQSKDTSDIRDLLPRGTTGFILIMWGGDVPGQKMDVFPIEVTSVGKSIPDSADADLTVQFAITDAPAEDVAIPA